MCKKLMFLGLFVLVLCVAGSTLGATILRCDVQPSVGACGPAKPGWTIFTTQDDCYKNCDQIPWCNSCWRDPHPGGVLVEDVNGTCIDIHIDAGDHIHLAGGLDRACEYGSCAVDPLAGQYFYAPDTPGLYDGAILLTFKNLPANDYTLVSYHNNAGIAKWYWDPNIPCRNYCELGDYKLIGSVEVSGAVSRWVGDYDIPMGGICKDSDFSLNPKMGMSRVRFTATGEGDVLITYLGKEEEGYTSANLNAFELLGNPICCGRLRGDLNGDCRVDSRDFAIFASEWLGCDLVPKSACEQ